MAVVVVSIVVIGLVMAYVPLLFRVQVPVANTSADQTASLVPIVSESTSTPTSSVTKEKPAIDSFSGTEKELQSLEDLNVLLKK